MVDPGELNALLMAGTAGMLLLVVFIVLYVVIYQRRMARQQEAHQRDILEMTLSAREQEARRISMALHDEVQPELTHVKMELDALAGSVPPTLRTRVKDAGGQITGSVEHIRHLSRQMYPALLRRNGLPDALEALCSESGSPGVEVDYSCTGAYSRLPEKVEYDLWCTVKELIGNALKHAGCSRITVMLINRPEALELLVSDNGRGFDPEQEGPLQTGLGMEHIRVRMERSGLRHRFESRPGEGVSFRAELQR